MSRPEDTLPPDLFYNTTESAKYTKSSRIRLIQEEMTLRALSLLSLPHPSLILDIGCGSGLSGELLSSPANGSHTWVGMDISPSMLDIAVQRETVEGDLLLSDMGQGIPFRAGTFDAAISISALQWLCAAPGSAEGDAPEKRLRVFFDGLYSSLRRGARAVLQFYPKGEGQRDMITKAAVKAGFGAGLLEDDGGTKNAKLYLVLSVGGGDITGVVGGLEDGEDVVVDDARGREMRQKKRGGSVDVKGSKAWILRRKEKMKAKGKIVKGDSRYTGRNRGPKF